MVLDSAATIGIGGSAVDLPDFLAEQPGFETSVALAKYVGLSRGKVRPKKSTGVA
jgi:hypothetical protein